ncbi:hypothetical protein C4K03_4230 [Pseudomonas synxantha]|uniref:Uncharacterized protein n=1 Tax=Pseudomonas synxantha TaxID=47883 RepID=A0A3G7UCR8_9PSED|nr:hypothetical protein C4K03_4230 [Pseudomonas synxantha]
MISECSRGGTARKYSLERCRSGRQGCPSRTPRRLVVLLGRQVS